MSHFIVFCLLNKSLLLCVKSHVFKYFVQRRAEVVACELCIGN